MEQEQLAEALSTAKLLPPRAFQRNFNSTKKDYPSRGKSTTAVIESTQAGESPKKLRKPPLLLKHLNSKTVTIGYKLGDGTSGKVY